MMHKAIWMGVVALLILAGCHSRRFQPTEENEATKDTIENVMLWGVNRDEVSLYNAIKQNRITIIDFWASWCGPCRVESPNLVAIYQDYKKQGVGFIGISLDNDYHQWQEGIRSLQLPWPQYSDLRKWDDTLVKRYAITSIPYTIVVDNQGHILATGLRGEALRATIHQLVNK